ncbi:MAG: hypothetical protein NDI94_06380 [Candidatus Woesearchaeota archaeon]|nr:hypothetical protein [Candidatus Woesearchaeota archaeon]
MQQSPIEKKIETLYYKIQSDKNFYPWLMPATIPLGRLVALQSRLAAPWHAYREGITYCDHDLFYAMKFSPISDHVEAGLHTDLPFGDFDENSIRLNTNCFSIRRTKGGVIQADYNYSIEHGVFNSEATEYKGKATLNSSEKFGNNYFIFEGKMKLHTTQILIGALETALRLYS